MFKGFDNITLNDFFKLSSTTSRGHTLKINKPQVHLDVRKFFFTVRIIDEWNSLPRRRRRKKTGAGDSLFA